MSEKQQNKEELNQENLENEEIQNEEQQNDFTEKKSLGSRKGMIALLFILIVLMLYGFLHSAFKSDKKDDVNEPQTKVVKEIKSETNKADYGEQNKRLQKEHEENQDIPYQKVQTPTVDPVATEEQRQQRLTLQKKHKLPLLKQLQQKKRLLPLLSNLILIAIAATTINQLIKVKAVIFK